LLTLALVWTNDLHHLVYTEIEARPEGIGNPIFHHGAWFWVNAAYAYLLMLAGTILLFISLFRAPLHYRMQMWSLALGASLPLAANLVYVTGTSPLQGVDPTPIAFSLTGLIYMISLWHLGFLELVPLARDSLIEHLSDGMLVVDHQMQLVDANPAAIQLLEIENQPLLGKTLADVFPALADDQDLFIVDGQPRQERTLSLSDKRILEVQTTRVQHPEGGFSGWVVNLRDITALKQAEETLLTSTESYRAIVESSGVPMVLTDYEPGGEVLYANQRAQELFQIEGKEAIGRPATDFYQDPEQRQAFLLELQNQGKVDGFELALRAASGEQLDLLVSARIIHYQGIPAILSTFQDVTEQRRRMDALIQERQAAESARKTAEITARQLQSALETLEQLATTDELTGALNRRRFIELMQRELNLARRYTRPAALILFDLDGFKQANDLYGHVAGDEVLRFLSNLLHENLRQTDYLVRWGGDEFVILTPETTHEQAGLLGEKVRALIAGATFPVVGKMTASLGLTMLRPDDSIDEVVRRADRALYQAKNQGGNCLVISDN
jgi:diguanylate cyclase (GGDEF)-like protein/PAS domain S-box-containing protein